jgi:hypothetical protein
MKRTLAVATLCLAPLLTGCVAYQPLQFEPVRRAGRAPTPVAPRFSESNYFVDHDHNLYFVMRSRTTDSVSRTPIDQVVTVRVFWHPKGGVTTLNASALNATFRYLIMTPDSLGMYEGAGFVRLNSKDGAPKFEARFIDGDMRLTQASSNFNDTLGRARIRGYFAAFYNDARAYDMLLQAQREFFYRSLEQKPAELPDAQPGTTRPAGAGPATGPRPEDWGFPAANSPLTPSTTTAPAPQRP